MGPQRCEAAVDEAQTSSWESGFAITINVPVWSMGAIVVLKTRKDLKPRTAWNAEIIENTTSVVKLRLTDWSDASQDFGLEGDASYSPKDIIDLYHDCGSGRPPPTWPQSYLPPPATPPLSPLPFLPPPPSPSSPWPSAPFPLSLPSFLPTSPEPLLKPLPPQPPLPFPPSVPPLPQTFHVEVAHKLVWPDAFHLVAGGLALLVIFAWCCPWHSAPAREAFGRWRSGGLKKHQQSTPHAHRMHGNSPRRRFQLVTQLPKVDEEPEEYISSTNENCSDDEDNDGRPCDEEGEPPPSIADQQEEQVSRQKDDEEEDEAGLFSSHLSAGAKPFHQQARKDGGVVSGTDKVLTAFSAHDQAVVRAMRDRLVSQQTTPAAPAKSAGSGSQRRSVQLDGSLD